MPALSPAPERSSRWRKPRNALLALGLGIVVGLLAGELGLRFVLFHPDLELGGLGRSIRQPTRYSNGDNEDDYWKLLCALQGPSALIHAPNPDPITGWTGTAITPGTYAHAAEDSLRGRRPVLLYGDSFAQGGMPLSACFESILERSEFAQQYALLNYGVGGYGFDQVYLLLANSIERFKAEDPIVIVSLLLESDLDRSVLEFRCWPKPRLEVVNDRLASRGAVQTNIEDYLAQNPISIRSYLWRAFLHSRLDFLVRQRAGWRGEARIEEEKRTLNRRILLEIEHELSSRHLKHFFLVFHTEEGALQPAESFQWQERLIQDFCAEFQVPLVDTRPFLSFASDGLPEKCARFYSEVGPLAGHHSAIGNLVCFEAIGQGLRGNFAQPDMQPLADLKARGLLDTLGPETTPTTLLGRAATLITHGSGGQLRATETSGPARLLLRSDASGSTTARFDLAPGAKGFTGRLYTMVSSAQGCKAGELRFSVELDGEIVFARSVPAAAEALTLDLNLAGKRSLALMVEGDRGVANCNWICIENPLLESP